MQNGLTLAKGHFCKFSLPLIICQPKSIKQKFKWEKSFHSFHTPTPHKFFSSPLPPLLSAEGLFPHPPSIFQFILHLPKCKSFTYIHLIYFPSVLWLGSWSSMDACVVLMWSPKRNSWFLWIQELSMRYIMYMC